MLLWQTCILKIIIVCSIAMTSPEHSTHQQVQVGFPQSHTASNGRPNDPPGNWGEPQKLECEILWNHKSINQHSEKLPKAWNLQTFIEIADETRHRLYMHVAGSSSRHMETLKWSVLHQPEVSCHFSFVSQQLSVDLRESQPTKYRN